MFQKAKTESFDAQIKQNLAFSSGQVPAVIDGTVLPSAPGRANVPARTAQGKPSDVVMPKAVPKSIITAIKRLRVAFPGGPTLSAEDQGLSLDNYVEAVEGFERGIAEFVLAYLRLHNPRNTEKFTQAPTAQDVHELCKKTREHWLLASQQYWDGRAEWSDRICGPAPGADGCWLARGAWLEPLRERIAARFASWRGDQSFIEGQLLMDMPDKYFDALPIDAFDDGVRDEIIAERQAYRQRKE